jgi:urease accessory protein
VAGVAPYKDGKYAVVGTVGEELGIEDGQHAARICALNLLATLRHACRGDLDRVERFMMVRGFVKAPSSFEQVPSVINGASDLIIDVFGADIGLHARTSIGCATCRAEWLRKSMRSLLSTAPASEPAMQESSVRRSSGTLIATAAAYICLMGNALAHHVTGNQMPTSSLDGFLSGLGHPVIGLDHLAAIVAVGCIASVQRRPALGVIGFVVFMLAGALIHLGRATVPGIELLVSLTVAVLGAVATIDRQRSIGLSLLLFPLAGLLHGYALADSIVGAQPAPLVTYLIGVALIQSAIGLMVANSFRLLLAGDRRALSVRLLGTVVIGIGLLTFLQQFLSGT